MRVLEPFSSPIQSLIFKLGPILTARLTDPRRTAQCDLVCQVRCRSISQKAFDGISAITTGVVTGYSDADLKSTEPFRTYFALSS